MLILVSVIAMKSARATFPDEDSRSVFVSDRGDNFAIYVMKPYGFKQKRIADNVTSDPTWRAIV